MDICELTGALTYMGMVPKRLKWPAYSHCMLQGKSVLMGTARRGQSEEKDR